MVLSALTNIQRKIKNIGLGFHKKTIISVLTFAVSFSSLVFVMWQIANCFVQYIQKPEGTKLSIENTADLPFPAITICKFPSHDIEDLKKCGLKR